MVAYPEDWKCYKITEIAKTYIGLVTTMTTNYSKDGVRLIRNQDIECNRFKFKENIFLNEKFASENDSRKHRVGDVVTVHTGDIGTSAVIDENLDGSLGFATIVTRANKNYVSPYYLSWFFNSIYFKEYIYSIMTGDGRNNLNMKDFNKTIVFLPPIHEQDKIVDTLSKIDTYINDLTELIEKKKAIREGALEDLTCGKIRLPGYHTDWISYPFRKYFSMLPTNTMSRDKLTDKGEIGDIHYGDVLIKYNDVLDDENIIPRIKTGFEFSEKCFLKEKDVIIADTAEDDTVGKAIQIGKMSLKLVSGLHTLACRPNYDVASGYLGYYLNSTHYHNQILPHITGIKVSSISKKAINTTELYLPSDVEEQKAIASILNAMDEEIAALESEREKMIQIREGAMDDLLTGRVRLV